jgi:hypothetical protein
LEEWNDGKEKRNNGMRGKQEWWKDGRNGKME